MKNIICVMAVFGMALTACQSNKKNIQNASKLTVLDGGALNTYVDRELQQAAMASNSIEPCSAQQLNLTTQAITPSEFHFDSTHLSVVITEKFNANNSSLIGATPPCEAQMRFIAKLDGVAQPPEMIPVIIDYKTAQVAVKYETGAIVFSQNGESRSFQVNQSFELQMSAQKPDGVMRNFGTLKLFIDTSGGAGGGSGSGSGSGTGSGSGSGGGSCGAVPTQADRNYVNDYANITCGAGCIRNSFVPDLDHYENYGYIKIFMNINGLSAADINSLRNGDMTIEVLPVAAAQCYGVAIFSTMAPQLTYQGNTVKYSFYSDALPGSWISTAKRTFIALLKDRNATVRLLSVSPDWFSPFM